MNMHFNPLSVAESKVSVRKIPPSPAVPVLLSFFVSDAWIKGTALTSKLCLFPTSFWSDLLCSSLFSEAMYDDWIWPPCGSVLSEATYDDWIWFQHSDHCNLPYLVAADISLVVKKCAPSLIFKICFPFLSFERNQTVFCSVAMLVVDWAKKNQPTNLLCLWLTGLKCTNQLTCYVCGWLG